MMMMTNNQTNQTKKQNKQKVNWTEFCGTNLCVCIVSGVNELRLSHEEKAAINGDIKLKLETIQPFQRRQRNWWLNTHTNIQRDLLVNADGRYECPRDYCGKTYKEASSLQRHIRCVFLVCFSHPHNNNKKLYKTEHNHFYS